MREFFKRIVFAPVALFKKVFALIKVIRLPKLPKATRLRLFYRVLISFIVVIVLFVALYGFGIYKFHWSRFGVQTVAKVVPYPAAFVGPSVIFSSEFYKQKSFIEHFYIKTETMMPEENVFNKQIMDRQIEQRLIEREFKKLKLSISKKDVESEYQKIIDQNQGEETIKKMLDDLYGMGIGDFKNLILDKMVLEKFKNEGLVSIHLFQIVVKDENRAKDISNQLNSGANFEDLAKKFSEDANSKDKGGDLGFVQRGSLVSGKEMSKEFENGAFSLSVGQISPAPIKTEFGWQIFKVTEKKGKIDKSYKNWLADAMSKTKIIKLIGK